MCFFQVPVLITWVVMSLLQKNPEFVARDPQDGDRGRSRDLICRRATIARNSDVFTFNSLLILERERNIDLLHFLIHSSTDSCMCPEQGSNPQPWCTGTMLQSAELPGGAGRRSTWIRGQGCKWTQAEGHALPTGSHLCDSGQSLVSLTAHPLATCWSSGFAREAPPHS